MPQLRWATIRAVGARTAGGGQTDETTATPYVRSHGEQTTRNTTVSPIYEEKPRKQSYEEKPRKQESREERRASTRTLPDY